ncbi:MAG: MarC family protein [Rhizomicrobium sp.]|jgi:multiple antibiotic resistance protein
MMKMLIENFVTLFVVVDPAGSIPVFLMATAGLSIRDRSKVALFAVSIALAVLMLFLFFAQYVLVQMHIGVSAFKIAGGAILFVFGLQMVLRGQHQGGTRGPSQSLIEIAVFPVAMPSIASPGALLAVVLLTDNSRFTLAEQAVTAALLVAVLLGVLASMLLAGRIERHIGSAGISVMTQVMGLVLAAFAIQQILDGLTETLSRIAH